MSKLIDIPKDIYSANRDIVILEESSAVIESIKNYIELEILDIPLTTNVSISAKQMLLKATTQPEIRNIVFGIKNKIEKNINQVKKCEVTYTDSGTTRTLQLELTMINVTDNLQPLNVVIRI